MKKLIRKPGAVPEKISNESKVIPESRPSNDEVDEGELLNKGFRDEILRNYGPDYWWYEDYIH